MAPITCATRLAGAHREDAHAGAVPYTSYALYSTRYNTQGDRQRLKGAEDRLRATDGNTRRGLNLGIFISVWCASVNLYVLITLTPT